MERLLTLREVVEYLKVSTRTVRCLLERGLPSVRFGRLQADRTVRSSAGAHSVRLEMTWPRPCA